MMDKTPLYLNTPSYAREHNELDAYRESRKENIACKEAIESAIRNHYCDYRLGAGALKEVLSRFSFERVWYVLAATVLDKDWDIRISSVNREWAKSFPVENEVNAVGRNPYWDYVVNSHSGLLDIFISDARREMARAADRPVKEQKPSVQCKLAKTEHEKLATKKKSEREAR